MRRATFLAALAALVFTAAAAAGGPGLKNLPIKVAVPKKGHIGVFAFKLAVKLPPGTTISGAPPPIAVHQKNGGALAKGTLAAAAVVKTGATTWQVIVVVDARKASGTGASTLNATIEVPPPYSANPVTEEKEDDPCAEYNRVANDIGNTGGIDGAAIFFWIMSGPTDKGREIVLDGNADC